MYEINCESCGSVGFHPSRIGAEARAERHTERTGHRSAVDVME
jgi:hypothetical protein